MAVFGLGLLAVALAPPGSDVAAWWPAAGVAVAFLVVSPSRRRPGFVVGVAVAAVAGNLAGGRAPAVALCFGLANAVEAATVVALLTRGRRGRPGLRTLDDLWRLILAAVAGSVLVGLLAGITVQTLLGGSLLSTWRTVTASHGASLLLVVPLGLALADDRTVARVWETVAQWTLTVAAFAAVFGGSQRLPLAFLPFPLLMWGAQRQPMRLVTLQLVVVGVLTSMLTSAGGGPFSRPPRRCLRRRSAL